MSGEQAFLKLPPLGKCQKVNSYNKEDDIYKMFIKLSRLHCKLKDPLKELLYQCVCEEEEECMLIYSYRVGVSKLCLASEEEMLVAKGTGITALNGDK